MELGGVFKDPGVGSSAGHHDWTIFRPPTLYPNEPKSIVQTATYFALEAIVLSG